MTDGKIRVTLGYEKLSEELQEQIKLVYPDGFSEHLILYVNKEGKKVSALRFETDEKVYLIRMSESEAMRIIEEDDDYDDDGYLKEDVKEDYEEKHSDVEYLAENENYESYEE
jgi:hypothetical protein